MGKLKLILIVFFINFVYGDSILIDNTIKKYEILSSSSIYIDNSNKTTIQDIKDQKIKFEKNDKSLLAYGYAPDFTVWIKFTLQNTTNKPMTKILEYANALTTNIEFYDIKANKMKKEGLLNINRQRKSLTPKFRISLKPKETKTYYLKVSSKVTTLIIKLNLWDTIKFYKKEIQHQFILALFFGAMFILAIYNIFIYFFTKDISYLYYVLYILGVTIHHSMYIGIAHLYFINNNWMQFFLDIAPIIITFPIYALALFTKSFLHIENQSIHNKILLSFLILIPISLIIIIVDNDLYKYRNILPLLLTIYLIYLTIYNTIKKNRQAYFILFGWNIIFIAIVAMNLSSGGIFNVYKYFNYIIELAFVLEGIVFSIALSDKINNLQMEKNEANKKLIEQQKNETERLELKVEEKTIDLKTALDEKGLLLKELNHRVKNNMQTIVSLIRLQSDEIEDKKYKDILSTIQNRISAMGHLHELLYQKDNMSHINAYEYFSIIIDELKYTYDNKVSVSLDIKTELKLQQAIYCGLILNELMTNAFKYAFPEKEGNIEVSLHKEDELIKLIVKDDGIGYEKQQKPNSLGLILIDTLTKKQLNGEVNIKSDDGVEVVISWNDDHEFESIDS